MEISSTTFSFANHLTVASIINALTAAEGSAAFATMSIASWSLINSQSPSVAMIRTLSRDGSRVLSKHSGKEETPTV